MQTCACFCPFNPTLRPATAAWLDPVPEPTGRYASSLGCNHRPTTVNSDHRFPLLAHTLKSEPQPITSSAAHVQACLNKRKRRLRLIDVRFNHRLANPNEWQTVKPIAVKAIYIPIVSLFWETIKKKKPRSWHGEGRPTRRKANKIICGDNPLSNWPQSGAEQNLLAGFLSHTQTHTTFSDCYVVTGAMQMSHDSLATVSLRHQNVNVLMAFGWNSLCVARLLLWKGGRRRAEASSGSLQHLDSSFSQGSPLRSPGKPSAEELNLDLGSGAAHTTQPSTRARA